MLPVPPIEKHLRRDSVSSLGTFTSTCGPEIDENHDGQADHDGVTRAQQEDIQCAPCSPIPSSRNHKSPLGVQMAILATSSPEIKALNLPIAPSFPETVEFSHRNNDSFDSSSSSLNTPLPDPVQEKAKQSSLEVMPNTRLYESWSKETPSTLRSLELSFQEALPDTKGENTHPNLIRRVSEGTPMTQSSKSLSTRSLRKSFHRRASFDCLPSPEEIGQSPDGTLSASPNRSSDQEFSGTRYRLPNMKMAPKRLQLSTAFR